MFLHGCATNQAVRLNPVNRDSVKALTSGSVRLTCYPGCAGSWGWESRNLRLLHDKSLWEELASDVVRINFPAEQTYYYLGRASEGLGKNQAAIAYYRLSLSDKHKCEAALNNCDGFALPNETLSRLDRLLQITAAGATVEDAKDVLAPQNKTIFTQATDINLKPLTPERALALQYSAKHKVEYDEFKKVTKISGSTLKNDGTSVLLRAWKLNTGQIDFQLYVEDYYTGQWRFYDEAWDSDGKQLKLTLIRRDVDSCSKYGCRHVEHVGVNLTREYLMTMVSKGMRFKLSGKAGEVIVAVPGPYIAAFLDDVM